MKHKRLRVFLIVFALLVATVSIGIFSFMAVLRARRIQLLAPAQLNTQIETLQGESAGGPGTTEETAAIPIDFGYLQTVNHDIYAWLQITDTDIAQPIVQHPTDDNHYLNYTIDGVYGSVGAIYTELCNARDFSDSNTVIYGHNMTDDMMFGGLDAYLDADYLQAHREVIVYTPTEKRTYHIFAAVVYDDTYIPFIYNPTKVDTCQAFVDTLSATGDPDSQVLEEITVTEDTRLLTLSTCFKGYSHPDKRYLIVAVQDA